MKYDLIPVQLAGGCLCPPPYHRHQSSLEAVIDLSARTQHLSSEQRDQATRIFKAVIEACEPLQHDNGPYKQITLVRLTYEYARSEASRDNLLRFFFQHTQIPMEVTEWDLIRSCDHGPELTAFADTLFENFFLPLKASTRKTPQPSPATLSEYQSGEQPVGTTQRLASLRRDCLIRDHHRCVISRKFDDGQVMMRLRRDGQEKAQDDDGNFLKDESGTFTPLEVAHIIPHSLMSVQSGMHELNESKKTALAILNMFDDGVVHLVDSTDIDRPRNAITLTYDFHRLFGNFEVYFEPHGNQPHTYRIDSTRPDIVRHRIFPVRRTLFLTDTRTIDPPSPRLLAVHRAIAQILHLSAAGHHIDDILRDLDEKDVMADGSTNLGHLATLRVHGWWDGRVSAY